MFDKEETYKLIESKFINPKITEVIRFINFAKEVCLKKLHNYYGLVRTKTHFKLSCLLPKISFDSLIDDKPYKFIFTSGTLPK